jgi:hypothetical protein
MVQKTYDHLGTIRHRAGVVEYLVEQHQEVRFMNGRTVEAALATPGHHS